MKKLLALLLLLTLAFPAAHAENAAENVTLLVKAEALAVRLDELAENAAYATLFTNNVDVLSIVKEWGEGNHDKPSRIVMLDLASFESMNLMALAEDAPEAARRMLKNSLGTTMVQAAINSCGVEMTVASSVVRVSDTFAAPVMNGNGVFVLLYEDAVPVAVSWYEEEGAVAMSASFLPGYAEDGAFHVQSGAQGGGMAFSCTDVSGAIDDGLTPLNTQTYAARALALADDLRTLAASDAWLGALALPTATEELVRGFVAADETPRLVLESTRVDFFNTPELPDGLTDIWGEDATDRIAAGVMTSIVAQSGSINMVAAVSSIRASDIFADEGAEDFGLYILLYEESAPIVVQWAAGEDAVSMQASFLPDEDLMNCRTAWEVGKWAEQYNLLLIVNAVPDETAAFPADRVDRLAQIACANWPAVCMDADLAYADTLALLEGCTYRQPTMLVPLEYVPTVLEGESAEAWESFVSGETMLMISSGSKSWVELTVEPAPSSASLIRIGVVNHVDSRVGSTAYQAEVTLTYNDPTLPDMSGGAFHFYADGAPLLAVWDVKDGAVELIVRPIPDAGLAVCQSPADVQAWLAAEECQVRVIGAE